MTKLAHECPHCGQPMLVKFGIRFQPKKAAMLDMIEQVTKGRGGIDGEALAWVFFPGVPKLQALQRVKSHICQINDMLVSTDWRVINANHAKREGAFYKLAITNAR